METTDLQLLMEEPPYGHNNGSAPCKSNDEYGQRSPFGTQQNQARELLQDGRFATVDTTAGTHTGRTYGAQDAGMTSHRGILHPDDYVHHDELLDQVERHFGFSFDEVRAVYTRAGGPLPKALRGLRSRIDARLLELHSAGRINIVEFARVMGLTEMGLHRALGRARKEAS